jgi:hypothetical protein
MSSLSCIDLIYMWNEHAVGQVLYNHIILYFLIIISFIVLLYFLIIISFIVLLFEDILFYYTCTCIMYCIALWFASNLYPCIRIYGKHNEMNEWIYISGQWWKSWRSRGVDEQYNVKQILYQECVWHYNTRWEKALTKAEDVKRHGSNGQDKSYSIANLFRHSPTCWHKEPWVHVEINLATNFPSCSKWWPDTSQQVSDWRSKLVLISTGKSEWANWTLVTT